MWGLPASPPGARRHAETRGRHRKARFPFRSSPASWRRAVTFRDTARRGSRPRSARPAQAAHPSPVSGHRQVRQRDHPAGPPAARGVSDHRCECARPRRAPCAGRASGGLGAESSPRRLDLVAGVERVWALGDPAARSCGRSAAVPDRPVAVLSPPPSPRPAAEPGLSAVPQPGGQAAVFGGGGEKRPPSPCGGFLGVPVSAAGP